MMQRAVNRMVWTNVVNKTFLGLLGLATAVGCGGRTNHADLGGETGFLLTCGSDVDCQSGLCACGVCSRTCVETSECGSGTCVSPESAAACNGETRTVCLPAESTSSGAPTDTAASSSAAECRGQGHYQAGKEGSYLPCCEGLTEVFQLSPGENDDGPICTDPPLRVYACVEGTCGDGVCEVGEDVRCGCVDDCPGAAWGNVEAGTANGGESSSDETTDNSSLIPPCYGLACEGALLSLSPGPITIEVDVQGPFCGATCGRVTPTLYDVSSGLVVPDAKYTSCDRCDGPPTSVCEESSVDGMTWLGEIGLADSVCEWSAGSLMYCQSAPKYVPAGRYRAELCTYSSIRDDVTGEAKCPIPGEEEGTPVCQSVEFDFPSVEPLVVRLNNLPPAIDGGSQTSAPDGAL